MRQSRAAPCRAGCRVGGCTCFFDKDEGKFLQNVWKNQFQTFPYKMFFIFHFAFLYLGVFTLDRIGTFFLV